MSRRQSTRVKIEVTFTLPVGKRPPWAQQYVASLLHGTIVFDDQVSLPALSVRLLAKETTYLT